jgi:hypothetical protein
MAQFEAGADHKVVTYYSEDTGDQVDLEAFAEGMAAALAESGSQGWRVVSANVFALRQVGTIGNVLLKRRADGDPPLRSSSTHGDDQARTPDRGGSGVGARQRPGACDLRSWP